MHPTLKALFLSQLVMAFLLLLLLSFVIICISSSLFFILLCRFRFRKLGLPPGNLGYPLVGESLELISTLKSGNPESFIDLRVKQYGKVFTTHLYGETTVFSTDPEVNRFILMNEGKLFESSYTSTISNLLGKHSLVMLKGSIHKKMYSLAISLMNNSSLRDHHFEDIDRLIRLNLDSWKGQIFLYEETKKITFELTVKQLMSIDPGVWTEYLRKHYRVLIDGFSALPLPFLFTTYGKAIHARSKVVEALRLKVKERKAIFSARNLVDEQQKKKKKDMLERLLEGECGFSEEEVVDFMLALIVGGYDTTSTIMTLAIKFLTENPLALAELKKEHEEIRTKKGNSVALDWSDYESMSFTRCVINESLRVANIVGGVLRKAMTKVTVKGYTIPKGYKVFASLRAVHMNEDHFKEATSFNPWRWQQKNSEGLSSSTNLFTPFGGGPRHCPGYETARVEISVFLHHFITTFSWSPLAEDKIVFFPTTRTLKNYPIDLRHRNRSLL